MKQNLRILLVEQNRYHARLIMRELSQKYPNSSISVFDAAQTALSELRRNVFDVAIIGLDLPDVDGLGFVQLIRKENRRLPIVAIGDTPSKQAAVEAVEAGADEYLARGNSVSSTVTDVTGKLCLRYSTDTRETNKHASAGELRQREQAALIRVTAGTLCHEVNNPLMTILGMTELILNNGCDGDQNVAKKLRIIQRSARRIQSALIRLSTIARPTIKETPSGKMIDPQRSTVMAKSAVPTAFSPE